MRVALTQINPVLGDFKFNADKIIECIQRAKARNCELVVFPESALFGYHPFDMLERTEVVEKQLLEMDRIRNQMPAGICAIVGCFTMNKAKKGRRYFNSAGVIEKGKAIRYFHKQLLPTGDVFDEARFLESGHTKNNFLSIGKRKILITICEDIWAWPDAKGKTIYDVNPLKELKGPVDLVVNLSASPFYPGKIKVRERLVKQTAAHFKSPMIYVNMIGAQDELIFDGSSFAVDKRGKVLGRAFEFEEDLCVVDFQEGKGEIHKQETNKAIVLRKSLVLGIRDFIRKAGMKKVVLGLSGGIDSALVACLAADAIGPQNVMGLAMPGPFSAPESYLLAKDLAMKLSIEFYEQPITGLYEKAKESLQQSLSMNNFGIVHENIQARLRGLLLMAYSNSHNALLLTTGNKSEYATGYCTLYGDMCGGLAPIADLTKNQVYEVARIYNMERELIPADIFNRAPTAELRPNQKDQDTLPPYEELDKSVEKLVTHQKAPSTATDHWLLGALLKSEFKRWQAPPILKVSQHAFGRGRRWPIACKK